MQRLCDFLVSFFGLILLSPLFLIVAILVKISSKGPVFYRGIRAGKDDKPFFILKFRSMVEGAEDLGGFSTASDDPRLTKIGIFLKRFQLDELPQLINILKGEMSLVGPRPEVISEMDSLDPETRRIILSVKPGITSLATLANPHEGDTLKGAKDPHQVYIEKIRPEKIRLNLEYVRTRSFWLDIKIIVKTFFIAVFK